VPRRLIALPLLSSAFYILAFPNFNQAWLAWISLVPISLYALRTTPARAFCAGWLSGTLAYAGILYWVIVTFQAAHLSTALACLCLFLLAGYLGIYWGAWAWFLKYNPNILAGAAAWVALEYLRTYLISGFPWALLADSQVRNLPLIQIASVSGVYGVSFLVVLANLAIAVIARSPCRPKQSVRSPRSLRSLAMTTGVILACYGYGFWHLHRPLPRSLAPSLKIALLQGNIDQYKKWNRAYVEEIEKAYESLVDQAAQTKPDLIIWPETSVPGYLLQDKPLYDWLMKTVRRSQTSHLIGSPLMINEKAYNSSFSINSEGVLVGEYDKNHLVPFGEVVPFPSLLGKFKFISILNDLGGFTGGTKSPVIRAAGVLLGVNICYEAIFPNLVRKSVRQGGELIANLTNDGWYMKTSAPYQHWAPNVFRAVENHRWLVRADNTGISGIIDPNGRVISSSEIFVPAVIHGTVEPLSDLTLYTRFGDLSAVVCILFCVASLLLYMLRIQ
jgi:apolipoprotein N-acyltransferase